MYCALRASLRHSGAEKGLLIGFKTGALVFHQLLDARGRNGVSLTGWPDSAIIGYAIVLRMESPMRELKGPAAAVIALIRSFRRFPWEKSS